MPDVPASRQGAQLLVVRRGDDALQDLLRGDDLVGPHRKQRPGHVEDAVPREDAQERVLGEERLGERGEVAEATVSRVGPPGRELKRVRRPALAPPAAVGLLDAPLASRVRVVLRMRAVGDDEELDVLEQPGVRPERLALVAVDLVERLLERDTTAL